MPLQAGALVGLVPPAELLRLEYAEQAVMWDVQFRPHRRCRNLHSQSLSRLLQPLAPRNGSVLGSLRDNTEECGLGVLGVAYPVWYD